MSRLGPLLLAVPVVLFGVWLLSRMGRSDEERIRETVEEMVEEWNDVSVRGVTSRLSEGFTARRGANVLATRELVGEALRAFYAQEADILAGRMAWRAELEEETFVVVVDDAIGARYDVVLRFFHDASASPDPAWVVRLTGEMLEEDGTWRVHTCEPETLEGDQIGGRW